MSDDSDLRPSSACVLCDRPLEGRRSSIDPAVGICASCAGQMGMLPVEDLRALAPEELDRLPMGFITLDAEGTILFFNAFEQRRSGMAREDVVGRNFFTQVAPCTRVRQFAGRYARMVEEARPAAARFRFVFRLDGGERLVQIHMSYRPDAREGLLLVREPAGA